MQNSAYKTLLKFYGSIGVTNTLIKTFFMEMKATK